MKLIEKKNQFRRDFTGVYQCEGCGNEEEKKGCYDDRYFHDVVTPDMKCKKCGKSTKDLGIKPTKVVTKYAEHEVI